MGPGPLPMISGKGAATRAAGIALAGASFLARPLLARAAVTSEADVDHWMQHPSGNADEKPPLLASARSSLRTSAHSVAIEERGHFLNAGTPTATQIEDAFLGKQQLLPTKKRRYLGEVP